MNSLRFTDVTPEDGKKYRHNSESKANSPYIVVGTYEGVCPSSTFTGLPDMNSLMAIWVKWPPFSPPTKAPFELKYLCGRRYCKQYCPQMRLSAIRDARGLLLPSPPMGATTRGQYQVHAHRPTRLLRLPVQGTLMRKKEEEDDTYAPPEGQGCFSFRQSLLLRAKDTYAARSTGNKYEIISKWLLTSHDPIGRFWPNLTSTPQKLLQRYYRLGHPAGLTDKTMLPYALPWHNAISDAEWQHKVGWFSHPRYLKDMEAVNAERTGLRFDAWISRTLSKLSKLTRQKPSKQMRQLSKQRDFIWSSKKASEKWARRSRS